MYHVKKQIFDKVELDVLEEILVGYYAPGSYGEYDLSQVKVNIVYEHKPQDKELEKIVQSIGDENIDILKEWLNFANPFVLDLEENK